MTLAAFFFFMACRNYATNEICSTRFGIPIKGNHGRAGRTVQYIVLHQLPERMAFYDAEFQRDAIFPLAGPAPKSLHYILNEYGAIHNYVLNSDTAWGVDAINGNTFLLPPDPTNLINQRMLHIGLEAGWFNSYSFDQLVNLVCCISTEFAVPVSNIITAYQVNIDQDLLPALPSGLITAVQNCLSSPPVPASDTALCCFLLNQDIQALEARIAALEAAGAGNVTLIATLQATVVSLQNQINVLNGTVGSYNAQISVLNTQLTQLLVEIRRVKVCLFEQDLCFDECVEDVCKLVKYQLLPANQMLVTPNQPIRINLQTKIKDTNPATVQIGPLWNASWQCDCDLTVKFNARLAESEWCAGKIAWVDMVTSCGPRTRLITYTSSGLTEAAVLSGGLATILSAQGCDIYFEFGTNDLSPKILEFAEVELECVPSVP